MAKTRLQITALLLASMGLGMILKGDFLSASILFSASGVIDAMVHLKEPKT